MHQKLFSSNSKGTFPLYSNWRKAHSTKNFTHRDRTGLSLEWLQDVLNKNHHSHLDILWFHKKEKKKLYVSISVFNGRPITTIVLLLNSHFQIVRCFSGSSLFCDKVENRCQRLVLASVAATAARFMCLLLSTKSHRFITTNISLVHLLIVALGRPSPPPRTGRRMNAALISW